MWSWPITRKGRKMGVTIDPIEMPEDVGSAIVAAFNVLLEKATAPLVETFKDELTTQGVALNHIETHIEGVETNTGSIDGKLTGLQPKLDQIINLLTQIEVNTRPAP